LEKHWKQPVLCLFSYFEIPLVCAMSAAQSPANKVLLRLVGQEHGESARPQQPVYEVYLAKFHQQKGKYFYCNLLTKTTSWDAPQGSVEEASAQGKSADELWKEIGNAFEDTRQAAEAVQKAESALLAARQRQGALLESVRPRGAAPTSHREPQAAAPAPQKQDSGKSASKSASAKISAPVEPVRASAEATKPIVAEGAPAQPAAPAAHKQHKIHVNWTQHKPIPDPAITSAQLQEAFVRFGAIDTAFVVKDSLAKKSLPFGFIEFKSADAAERAVAAKSVSIGSVVAKISYAKGH
jgi:hypothetical protein